MGQHVGDGAVESGKASALDQIQQELGHHLLADAMAPAPNSLGQRLAQVTEDGIKKIPEGFKHSLDPKHILPNMAVGFGIGAGSKLILPEGGPVAKAAGLAMGAYFVGKPIAESYLMAANAKTVGDMNVASSFFGDTVGGMPVAMAEAGVGAAIGSKAVGGLLASRVGAPIAEFKASQYAKLDAGIDAASAGIQNVAFEKLGVGSPVMRLPEGGRAGIVPPYVLESLAKSTKDPAFLDTIKKTEALSISGKTSKGTSIAHQDFQGAREVYDAKGQETMGTKVRSEGEPKTGNVEIDNSYDFTGNVRDFYRDVHNRNSIDGKGMKLKSTVNYGDNYENAFWDGTHMTYGKPGPNSPFTTFILRDVTGHEITHGVTEYEAGFVYRNQPGALNESVSDVYGALITQKALGQSAAEASWLVGDGIWKPEIKGRALRDMRNPGTAYDDPMLGKDPQPAHMKDYLNTRRDNGGVHLNSGIPNKAFADFAVSVGGNAWEAPGHIWYDARAHAGSSPSFAQFAYQTIESAKRLGHTDLVPKLEKSWGDVGVKPSATDTGAADTLPTVLGALSGQSR